MPKGRKKQLKSLLADKKKSMLPGAIGSIAWKSSQIGPHFQADVAGGKIGKRELEQITREMQEFFVGVVRDTAQKNQWPWEETNVFFRPTPSWLPPGRSTCFFSVQRRPTPYGFRQVVQHVSSMLHMRLIN